MLSILGSILGSIIVGLIETIAFVGEILGLVEFAAKIRRWWDGEAEPDPDDK